MVLFIFLNVETGSRKKMRLKTVQRSPIPLSLSMFVPETWRRTYLVPDGYILLITGAFYIYVPIPICRVIYRWDELASARMFSNSFQWKKPSYAPPSSITYCSKAPAYGSSRVSVRILESYSDMQKPKLWDSYGSPGHPLLGILND